MVGVSKTNSSVAGSQVAVVCSAWMLHPHIQLGREGEREGERDLPAQGSWPPLVGLNGGRVEDKLIRGRVKGRCGLQGLDITAMSHLRLCIAPQYLLAPCQRDPVSLLLFAAQAEEAGEEHQVVQEGG